MKKDKDSAANADAKAQANAAAKTEADAKTQSDADAKAQADADAKARVGEAQAKAASSTSTPVVPPPPSSVMTPEAALQKGERTITMLFPRPVLLTTNDRQRVQFKIGPQEVPERLANHPYLRANGVTRYRKDSTEPQKPA